HPINSALITGLQAGVTYQFRLRVICGTQAMPWQGPITLTIGGKVGQAIGDGMFQVSLFPNPNPGRFTVSIQAETGTVDMRILDFMGRTVYVGTFETQTGANQYNLDLSQMLSPGLYFLQTESPQGTATAKFFVE
ncbi:MAG: T9SS type A sorting domain-containing protein, partial [Bacteroidia bacterium]|nr:T9SS type A sorting domain-containing protein [Bacteroidia bacterium]